MATKAPVKKTRVTKAQVNEHRTNAKKDFSPKWDDVETLSADAFSRKFRQAMDWYRLDCTDKTLKPKVIDWMIKHEFDKEDIAAFKKTKDNRCSGTVGAIAACLLKGMPAIRADFNEGRDSGIWLREQIARIINEGKNDIDEDLADKTVVKVEVPVVTIQDRLREAAGDMSEELDIAIDSWITDPEAFDPKAFKVVNLLKGKGVKAAHARLIKLYFQRGQSELLELASGNADEQLREGYSHMSRKNIKKMIDFYESIASACEQIAAEAKVMKKPRAKKAKPAEQIVAKLKFCIKDDKLGIVSVPPAQLVGAQGAIVYNTKTRKLGIYIPKTSAGLNVKGTSIIDFTEKSFQRTLRKPEVQLKEFKEQNTQKRIETWFSKIKTTETMLNGRMNEDVILLKVFK